jgi:hypothetical protein
MNYHFCGVAISGIYDINQLPLLAGHLHCKPLILKRQVQRIDSITPGPGRYFDILFTGKGTLLISPNHAMLETLNPLTGHWPAQTLQFTVDLKKNSYSVTYHEKHRLKIRLVESEIIEDWYQDKDVNVTFANGLHLCLQLITAITGFDLLGSPPDTLLYRCMFVEEADNTQDTPVINIKRRKTGKAPFWQFWK